MGDFVEMPIPLPYIHRVDGVVGLFYYDLTVVLRVWMEK